jgi:hypothetical protein
VDFFLYTKNKYSFYFIKTNGDLFSNCGITTTAIQHAELRAFAKTTENDGSPVANATGKAKNKITTTQLCEKKLKFIKHK